MKANQIQYANALFRSFLLKTPIWAATYWAKNREKQNHPSWCIKTACSAETAATQREIFAQARWASSYVKSKKHKCFKNVLFLLDELHH